MKKTLLFSGAVAVVLFSAGCGPEVAQGTYGAEEQLWYNVISSSYPGYRPPRIASPAMADKAAPEALAQQRENGNGSVKEVLPPAADEKNGNSPAADVDSAADKTAKDDKKADAKKDEAKPEAKDEKKADVKKDEAKPEAKDEKKADAKKDEAKPEAKDEKKADAQKTAPADYEIYKVKAGDTPGSIARKFYGKASMYEVIMKANPQIKDAKLIQIDTEIKIPKL